MKLISCYIENFGNLSQVSYSFDSNLTSFYHENGFGKSTLACFIKAMFYGLESYKSNSVGFADRMHYFPFNQQAFGGNLTFEYQGKIFKIERFFDEKSETKDTFKLFENGNLSEDFDENIGEQIFAIDKKAFERLMFVTDEDIEIKTNTSINSKLNTLLEGRDDTNLDEVIKELEKVSKYYKDSKSEKSKVYQSKEKVKELKTKIINEKKILDTLESKYKRLDNIKNEISLLKDKQYKSQKYGEYKANLDTYNSFVAEAVKLENDFNELNSYFSNGVISKVELDILKDNLSQRKILQASLNNQVLTVQQQLELSDLSKKYENSELTEEKLSDISSQITSYNKLTHDIERIDNIEYEEKDLLLEKKFSISIPSQEKLDEIKNNIDKLNEDKETYQNMDSFINEEVINKTETKLNKNYLIIAIICAIFALVSIPLFFVNLILGTVILAMSVVSLLIDGFLYLNNKQSNAHEAKTIVTKENVEKIKLKSSIDGQETLIKAFFISYGYECENGVSYELAKLKEDISNYNDFIKRKNININARTTFVKEKEEKSQLLEEFFKSYKIIESSYSSSLELLRKQLSTYSLYKELQNKDNTDKQEAMNSIKEKDEKIECICRKYDFEISTIEQKIDEITTKVEKINDLCIRVKDSKKKAQEYKNEKDIKDEVVESVEPLEEINAQLTQFEEARLNLSKEIDEDEYAVSSYQDDEIELENLTNDIKEYKEKYDVFEKTMSSLKQAEQNLKDKYIGPVKDKFIQYSNVLEKALGDRLEMSKDFEIYFERNGQLRSEKHLSSGLKSICALCFRLALLDNMYLNDKPFIILDDPFVLLDENHLEKTKEIIKKLSNNIQIVYFTCHNSRKI